MENKIDKLINGLFFWIGFIGTGVLMASELAILVVMIMGFDNGMSVANTLIISALLSLFALGVAWLMTIQGIKFAESIEANKGVMKEYEGKLVDNVKVAKSYGMGHF